MVVFLIGYMGSGKSYLGALSAKALNVSFYDLDAMIERKYNKSIKDISSTFKWKIFNTEFFIKFHEKNILNFK